MNIFDTKLDLYEDRLWFQFDIYEKKYNIYSINGIVLYDSLNKRTKKILDKKNELLLDPNELAKVMQLIKDAERCKKLKAWVMKLEVLNI